MKYTPSRSLKILMPVLYFDEVPGGWTYFKEMALRLEDLGHKIIILSPHSKGKKHSDKVKKGIIIYRFSSIYLPQIPLIIFNPIAFISTFIKLIRLEKNIDLIYDTTSGLLPSSLFAKLFMKNKKIPIVLHVCGELKEFKNKRFLSLFYELYLNLSARLIFSISDRILLAGKKIAPRILRLGANSKKMNVVRIGLKYENKLLNRSEKLNKKEITKFKTSFGINKRDFVMGYVGRLSAGKGLETLFRAIALVKKIIPNIKLLIIGDGGLKKRLYLYSSELDIQDITLFLGYRDDVTNLLQIMDLFLNLSDSEADISATQLEAMIYGLPSVITPFTELIDNMKEAIIVPFNNAQAVNDAILFMYNNENMSRKIGQNASVKSKEIMQSYTWDSYLSKVTCTFKEFVEDA